MLTSQNGDRSFLLAVDALGDAESVRSILQAMPRAAVPVATGLKVAPVMAELARQLEIVLLGLEEPSPEPEVRIARAARDIRMLICTHKLIALYVESEAL